VAAQGASGRPARRDTRIQAHRPIVTITPFGGEARTGHFTPGRVWIEDANGGVVEERATPRASFAGHVLTTPWDKLQELYFVSYALWNYLATPFMFTEPGFETREIGPHEENGETWHRLLVKYPPSIPAHCAEQVLYFNAQGLLQRMDYSVDVVGDMVMAARSQHLAVHGKRHADDPLCMPAQGTEFLTGPRVPQLDCLVQLACGQHVAIRAERHACHRDPSG
jgi:hypothetical protein